MGITFGYGLVTCQRYPGDGRDPPGVYSEALELASLADRLGLDSVFVSEHHFVDDGYLPSLLPMCAAIAARTERVRIGTGLLLAPLHDPIRLAEDAAVVDLLSGGRLVLGLGLGWRREEFDGFGVPLRERVARLEEAVDVLRQSWGDGLVTRRRDGSLPPVAVHPKPCRPGGPPVWIGAMSEPALRRAGRIADGLMATEVEPQGLAQQIGWAQEAAAELGRHVSVSVHIPTFAWTDGDAWELAREHIRYVTWKYEDMDQAWSRTGPPPSPPPWAPDEAEALRASALVGPPEEIASRIDAYRRAAGGELLFIARVYLPGQPFAIQRRALEIYANEVVPRVLEMEAR
ncbi:MAG: LLM class flavin-dependent oxidoreductase [Acidimicrobiales bacterium]